MGVSFKVARTGNRYKPKVVVKHEEGAGDFPANSEDSQIVRAQDDSLHTKLHNQHADEDQIGKSKLPEPELEVSFTLNLYVDGYRIGWPAEDGARQTVLNDSPKFLHPYDRASETFFAAIECGRFPGDALDEKICKFSDGSIICEVRDYRKYATDRGGDIQPVVQKVSLKISLEDVVKDIPLMSDHSWTYGDLMEVEAQIVKALQPRLSLDPTPQLDRLCSNPVPGKISLGLSSIRRKRSREHHASEVTMTTNNLIHGKKVYIEKNVDTSGDLHVLDNAALRSRNVAGDVNVMNLPLSSSQSVFLGGFGASSELQDQGSAPATGASSVGHDMLASYHDRVNFVHGKREINPLSSLNKRSCSSPQMGPPMDGNTSDMNWRSPLLQQTAMPRGIHYASQNSAQATLPVGQASMRFGSRFEQLEAEILSSEINQMRTDITHFDPQQRQQQNLMRTSISQTVWSNQNQDLRKEEQFQKRKSVQSPRVSSGALAQSPLSSKSGEFSSGSGGPHFGAVVAASSLGSQKDKSIVTSGFTGGATASNTNDALRQPPNSSKRRSNSVNKTPGISAVGSPVSVSTNNVQLNANSPSVGTPATLDQTIVDRFSKIEIVMARNQLLPKPIKVDNYPSRKVNTYSHQNIAACLANPFTCEDVIEDSSARKLSYSLIGGSVNTCKARVINFLLPGEMVQGNSATLVPKMKTRLILMEKPTDGTVAMHYGEIEEADMPPEEEYLPSLPNAHMADLLATQFCALMVRDGFVVEDDRIQTKLAREGQTFNEAVSIQPPNPSNVRMLPPQASHSLLSMPLRPHQVEQPQPSASQSHNDFGPQFQRQSMVLPSNSLPHMNAHMASKASIQMHMLQQQQQPPQPQSQSQPQPQQSQPLITQQQKQSQLQQRKLMMGLGTAMGMGNLTNNIAGIGGLNNTMGIGGVRGIGSSGMSGPISLNSLGHLSQNPNITTALNQQLRNGQITPQEAALYSQKIRMVAQNRPSILGGSARPVHSGSTMLGRGNMNPMPRGAMGPMGPPKLMTGMNMYSNPQQLQQQQQFQQLQQQHLQQQQLQQLQEATSSFQSVVSPSQVGSPSTIVIPQMSQQQSMQQPSPQQLTQRTPVSPQMSAGAVHPMSAGNPDGCPASPQLSSQTLGSAGSITNSPMDLQGVNKGSSINGP